MIDNDLLNYHKKCQPEWTKTYAHTWNNWPIRPGLFDEYHQITYSLQFSIQYHVQCNEDFMPKKPSKKQKM